MVATATEIQVDWNYAYEGNLTLDGFEVTATYQGPCEGVNVSSVQFFVTETEASIVDLEEYSEFLVDVTAVVDASPVTSNSTIVSTLPSSKLWL